MSIQVLHGDARVMLPTLADRSVQCCVTSPPYFGLRAYLPDGHPDKGKEIGLEPTPDAYVAEMVAVFREVRRVLRDDGTLWLNLGDSYASSTKGSGGSGKASGLNCKRNDDGTFHENSHASSKSAQFSVRRFDLAVDSLKPKDLLGIPWRVALALRADGWYLRQDIIWHKPNPMPESVTDRCTKAHEYLFLLSKSARYFYDADAIAEPHADSNSSRHAALVKHGAGATGEWVAGSVQKDSPRVDQLNHRGLPGVGTTFGKFNPEGRNARSVWTIASQPFSESHFATMPPDLAERCIKAGTSEKGCCPDCGAPWERVTEQVKDRPTSELRGKYAEDGAAVKIGGGSSTIGHSNWHDGRNNGARSTTGWRPTCGCPAHAPVPCTVLDPFSGAGTTGLVADRLQRHYIGIELNDTYRAMSQERIRADAPLFAGAP